jgi:aminopeptidase N
MQDAAVTRLADYRRPPWTCTRATLAFELAHAASEVSSTLDLAPDPQQPGAPLRLDGEELELLEIALDGEALPPARYRQDPGGLTVFGVDGPCRLTTRVRIRPAENARLEGLYSSGAMLLTQCEAEGFRRITFFPDRPDVLARFEVTLRADRSAFPVLLSNGNLADSGVLDGNRHFARWVDPWPKPCYLFALVAGALERQSARFTTSEGRAVEVNVWAAPEDVPRCAHALDCVLRAMDWDQRRFGRCYDLDVFNVVAAQDFTMGAMENKGLNIFNARYILADVESATDADFEGVESVIGHEYFHNWSGNRVTVRDWFQLALKEGLTVFRDQEFTADMNSRALKRIEDVRLLKSRQFVEDAGPLAHPVRPPEYREINNFYTATVYEKGAEIVRMLHTLLGEATFRAGLDRYFAGNDGRAAVIEDFLAAMAEASGRDLAQFARWYAQAGTPVLAADEHWDEAAGRYTLHIRQQLPSSGGQTPPGPLHLPLALTLYDADGRALELPDAADAATRPGLVELTAAEHTLVFEGLAGRPLPAFLHGLSAPARVAYDYDADGLARLVLLERDPFNRWDAAQRLASGVLLRQVPGDARAALVDVLGALLDEPGLDPALVAECLTLPDFDTLADQCVQIDVDALWRAREDLLDELAECHADRLERCYRDMATLAPAALTPPAIAARRLKNVALSLLSRLDPRLALAAAQFERAATMTDRLAALRCLLHFEGPGAEAALAGFARRWRADPLVTDKWLALVATIPQPGTVERVGALLADAGVWQPRNPNRVRALLGSFARGNPLALHRLDGAGYALLCEQARRIDGLNPQVAARLLTALEQWHRLEPRRRAVAGSALDALDGAPASRDLADVLARLRVAAR